MAEHPVDTWARVKTLQFLFFDICQDSYSNYLALTQDYKNLNKDDYEQKHLLDKQITMHGIQTIVFAGMCAEAAIYDYAAIQLGDSFVQDHFDKMDLLLKWVVIPKFICGKQIRKDKAPYSSFKRLVQSRNRLVHHKSAPVDFSNSNLVEWLENEEKKFKADVNNAYRAIVLLSLEMDFLLGSKFNPLIGIFKKDDTAIPSNLVPIVKHCKQVFSRSKQA